MRQDEYQRMDDQELWKVLLYNFPPAQWVTSLLTEMIGEGGGKWPGGTRSWGWHRVWLRPHPETNTFGRDGFAIHGGDFPGSAGCVDLTSQMRDFAIHFRAYGADMDLVVKYR